MVPRRISEANFRAKHPQPPNIGSTPLGQSYVRGSKVEN